MDSLWKLAIRHNPSKTSTALEILLSGTLSVRTLVTTRDHHAEPQDTVELLIAPVSHSVPAIMLAVKDRVKNDNAVYTCRADAVVQEHLHAERDNSIALKDAGKEIDLKQSWSKQLLLNRIHCVRCW